MDKIANAFGLILILGGVIVGGFGLWSYTGLGASQRGDPGEVLAMQDTDMRAMIGGGVGVVAGGFLAYLGGRIKKRREAESNPGAGEPKP